MVASGAESLKVGVLCCSLEDFLVPNGAQLALSTAAAAHPKPFRGDRQWRPAETAISPPLSATQSASPLPPIAFAMGLAWVFVQFSMVHQVMARLFGTSFYLLYVVAIPSLFGLIISGAIWRSFRGRTTYYWLAFTIWMAVATPFSSWRSDSAHLLFDYVRAPLALLFVTAGLAISWGRCRLVLKALGWACVCNLLSSRLFERDFGERGGLDFGSIANPNDFAAHLLLVLPFLLWIGLSSKWILLRVAAFLGVGFGIFLVLSTASRGASIALGADVLFFLWRAPARQKVALLLLGPIAACVFLVAVPGTIWDRIRSFSSGPSIEAVESFESRRYLLDKSIEYTLKFPLFGVGPGQFASYEGGHSAVIGTHGTWHNTHNTFTQVSAECGIPGLLFFVCAIASSLYLLNSTHREARRRPECRDISTAVFCIMLGMVGFCVAITFLSFAYSYYLPCMGGLAVAIRAAAQEEFRVRVPAAAPAFPGAHAGA